MMDQAALNNRSNQMNPNHVSYWTSRGFSGRPDNWNSSSSSGVSRSSSAGSSSVGQGNNFVEIVEGAVMLMKGLYDVYQYMSKKK